MSTLTVSNPVAKASLFDAETQLKQSEHHISNEVLKFFPQNIASTITQYVVKIPSCSICLQKVAYPVILGCGHLFDLDCISDWAREKNTCPIDRTTIDSEKIRYAEGIIKKVSAVFNFRFFHAQKIDPIAVNVYSSVQRLKLLVSLGLSVREKNLLVAAFFPNAHKEPKSIRFVVSDSKFPMKAEKIYSDTLLTDNEIIKPGGVYNIHSLNKYSGLCCDRCDGVPEIQTCNHPD